MQNNKINCRMICRTVFCAAAVMVLSLGLDLQAAWIVDKQPDGGIILRNEDCRSSGRIPTGALPMGSGRAKVKKIFDLTQLPADALKNAGSAYILIRGRFHDYGKDGLMESLNVIVNGKKRSFYMADLVPPKYNGASRWIKLPFPKEWISGNELTVVIHKETADRDDYLYLNCEEGLKEPTVTSCVSYDNGKSFSGKWYKNEGKGELVIRLGLSPEAETVKSLHYRAWAPETSGMILGKGVKVRSDGILELRGGDAAVTFKDSEKFNITPKGMTAFMTFRLFEDNGTEGASLFSKEKSFLTFGSTHRSSTFVNISSNGNRYAENVLANRMKLGEWCNLALSAEFIHEPEQSNIGYRVSLYLNGILQGQKMFYHFSPDQFSFPVQLGVGYPDKGFCGEIESFDFYPEYLNEAEMMSRIRSNIRFRQAYRDNRPGYRAPDSAWEKAAAPVIKSAITAEAKWLVAALRNSAGQGADGKMVLDVLKKLTFIGDKNITAEELAAKFNQLQQDYSLAVTSGFIMLSANHGTTNPAVAGVFNRINKSEIFNGRPLDWRIDFGKIQVFPYSEGVTFRKISETNENGVITRKIQWNHADFELIMTVKLAGQRMELDFCGKSSERKITGYRFPQFQLARLPGKNDYSLFPFFSGILSKSPTQGVQMSGTYPSARAAMLFGAYYDNSQRGGIYVAVEDPDASTRDFALLGRGGMLCFDYTQTAAYDPAKAGNAFSLNGTAVLELFDGNWFDAGRIYRRFLEKEAFWYVRELPRKSTPEWFRNLPLWFHNIAGTKEGYLYFNDYLGTPFGINGFARNKEFVERGLRNKPYTNSRLWKYTPVSSKQVDHTRDADALEAAVIQQDGKAYTEKFGKPYIVPCPTNEVWQEMLFRQIEAQAGKVDVVYHDQLACAAPKVCYNLKHNHLPGSPDNWTKAGYIKMFNRVFKEIHSRYPDLTHDSEDASEPYAATLDAFMVWRFIGPDHVPLFQSIYGGGRVQFNGRASDVHGVSGSYASFFPRIGEQFVYGEQLGWFNYNEFAFASPRRPFVKKLTRLRYNLVNYLNAANMLPPLTFKKAVPRLRTQWAMPGITRLVDTDKILHCAWQRIDGAVVVLFVNTVNETLTVEPLKASWMDNGAVAVCREGTGKAELYPRGSSPAVTIKPYSAEIWFIGGKNTVKDAEKIAALMKDFPEFDEGRTLYNQQRAKPVKVAAAAGEWIPAKSCTGYERGFMSPIQAFGNSSRSRIKEFRWNWICGDTDTVINYGQVDCGKGVEELEFRLAVTAKDAGKFHIYGKDNKLLGSGETSGTGEWFDFKCFRVKLNEKLSGEQSLSFKFERPVRFSAWRSVTENSKEK